MILDNFLCAMLDAVHPPYPFQLITGLHLLSNTFSPLHPINQLFQHLMRLLVDIHQILLQRTFQNHHLIDNRTMLFQIILSHAPIFADVACELLWEIDDGIQHTVLGVSVLNFRSSDQIKHLREAY